MPAVPPWPTVAVLIGINPDDPTDAEDYVVLRGLVARRVASVEQARVEQAGLDAPPSGCPDLRVVLD